MHDIFGRRDAARSVRNDAEVARERGRERLRVAERAQAEAGFAERSTRDRLADLERRRESLFLGMSQQRSLLEQAFDGEFETAAAFARAIAIHPAAAPILPSARLLK